MVSSTAEYTAMILGALLMLVFLLQKFLTGWKANSAESNIISLMHEELERMSIQNAALSKELSSLQLEVIKLSTELRVLTTENQRLHTEVASLTKEISRLQAIIKSTAGE